MVQFAVSQPKNNWPTTRTSATSENTERDIGRVRMKRVTLIGLFGHYFSFPSISS